MIHTDNGVPCCFPSSLLALSTLPVCFPKLGIVLERSRPGKPLDNASRERMHRVLKEVAARPPRRGQAAQQRALGRFRRICNAERPHHALKQQTPSRHHRPSPRPCPDDIRDVACPPHFEARRISRIGVVNWKRKRIFVGTALANEPLGFEHLADDL